MPAPKDCTGCPLAFEGRRQVVNGYGPATARIIVVGEAPGENEDIEGRGFVGESGQVLRQYMRKVGIDPESVYWLNACRCHPRGNRTPRPEELAACRRYLIEDIERLRPNLILAVGAPGLSTVQNQPRQRKLKGGNVIEVIDLLPITKMRGSILQNPDTDIKVVPIYHPAFIGRDWSKEPEMLADLAKAVVEARTPEYCVDSTEPVFLTTIDDVRWFRDWLYQEAPTLDWVVLDIETTGLKYLNDEILCLGFVPVRGDEFFGVGYVVPIRGQHCADFWGSDLPEVVNLLQDILGGPFRWAGQNIKFDQKHLERAHGETSGLEPNVFTAFGFQLTRDEDGRTALATDTLLAFHLLHETRPHTLDYQRSLYTNLPYYDAAIEAESKGKKDMAAAMPETLWTYQACDVDCTARLSVRHEAELNKDPSLRWIMDNIALPLHDFTRRVEQRGVLIDRDHFDQLCREYDVRLAEEEAKLWQYHEPFNYKSPDQKKRVLFQDLGLPRPGIKTKAGKSCQDCRDGFCEKHDATGEEALLAIKKQNPHPIIDQLLVMADLVKMKGTYLDGTGGKGRGLLDHITRDGRIHTNLNIAGTKTGRFSSTEPDLQNPPKSAEYRRIFVAPPGCLLMEADWAQLELWIMAYISGDESMLAVLESGQDIHTYVARRFWPNVDPQLSDDEWALRHSDLRKKAKGFDFGVNYGMSSFTVTQRFGTKQSESDRMVALYTQKIFSRIGRYFAGSDRDLMRGIDALNCFGRRRRVPGVRTFRHSRTFQRQIGHLRRERYNFPIQSSGTDTHSVASCRIDMDDWLLEPVPILGGAEEHERSCVVLTVHDSIVNEVAGEDPDDPAVIEVARYVKATMEEVPRVLLGWNLPVELKWGPSWGELVRVMDRDGNVKTIAIEE